MSKGGSNRGARIGRLLVVAILIMAIFLLLATWFLLRFSVGEQGLARAQGAWQAYYLALAGLERARLDLLYDVAHDRTGWSNARLHTASGVIDLSRGGKVALPAQGYYAIPYPDSYLGERGRYVVELNLDGGRGGDEVWVRSAGISRGGQRRILEGHYRLAVERLAAGRLPSTALPRSIRYRFTVLSEQEVQG